MQKNRVRVIQVLLVPSGDEIDEKGRPKWHVKQMREQQVQNFCQSKIWYEEADTIYSAWVRHSNDLQKYSAASWMQNGIEYVRVKSFVICHGNDIGELVFPDVSLPRDQVSLLVPNFREKGLFSRQSFIHCFSHRELDIDGIYANFFLINSFCF
jgi:hypothetical protein